MGPRVFQLLAVGTRCEQGQLLGVAYSSPDPSLTCSPKQFETMVPLRLQVPRGQVFTCPSLGRLSLKSKGNPFFLLSISAKDLKNMLSQVNYRVPNMRFLRERLTVMDPWGCLLAGQEGQ